VQRNSKGNIVDCGPVDVEIMIMQCRLQTNIGASCCLDLAMLATRPFTLVMVWKDYPGDLIRYLGISVYL
jgi:hypothetical protein